MLGWVTMGHSVAGAATACLKVLAETEALDPVFVSFGLEIIGLENGNQPNKCQKSSKAIDYYF